MDKEILLAVIIRTNFRVVLMQHGLITATFYFETKEKAEEQAKALTEFYKLSGFDDDYLTAVVKYDETVEYIT